uniref:Cyclic nucleotide-binding domain-containing protein n=1 Tax=Hanusia phi TaxID=3032 RepID=A0A7S0HH37_9CRYP|mmetsp:Transcript_1848/g.4049  ORF Transcript_1848/g.4049 Transcript_1848/m.4049 type:complete len:2764 (+) Transcript_1848:193-8484(+)
MRLWKKRASIAPYHGGDSISSKDSSMHRVVRQPPPVRSSSVGTMIDRAPSTLSSAWLKVSKKKNKQDLKPCLRPENSSNTGYKIQRVRFYIPKSRLNDLSFEVWHPSSPGIQRWHDFFALPLTYELWAGGFRLALASPSQSSWLFYADLSSDMLFVVDGLVKLNTGLILNKSEKLANTGEQNIHIDRGDIARNYFLSQFWTQLVPGIVFLGVSVPSTSLWLWWFFMFVRLVPRAWRLYKFFGLMEMNLSISISRIQLIKFCLVIFMSSHWIGCLFFWVPRTGYDHEHTWMVDISTYFPAFDELHSSTAARYLVLLYKGFDGLSSMGYLPIIPQNALEMVLSVLVMFNSIFLSAYILGTLFHYLLVSQKDPLTEAHRKRMADVLLFAEARKLPPQVKRKLVQHFEFQYKKSVQRKSSAALKLPRSLEVKVANSRFRPTVEKCCKPGGIFFRCNSQFLNALVTLLRPVFFMPGDQFIRASEMVLELSFVMEGHAEVVEEDTVKRIVRSDVEDPSVIGEVSFFLGVQQQYSVRAPYDTDIELLVLSKESAEELFKNYPEQHEIISNNILQSFNLDKDGNDLADVEMTGDDREEDADAIFLRNLIKDTVKRRREESFLSLSYAATAGDLEEVRRMLRKGVGINACNYDGKTIMHMAAAEGNYRVVELLLEEGADKNQKDRWGNTPLQDAVNANQGPVVQLLVQWKSTLNTENASSRLCTAASQGDLETLKLWLEHGVDPNACDCDMRTPLHVAASEGYDKIVEYLIAKGSNVNAVDRWKFTPLQAAVAAGHVQVAEEIRSKDGLMKEGSGPLEACEAASEGDVRHLRLLRRCGIDPDTGNYDNRCPLHLAALKGRILAVSYLLGASANPNRLDRWGCTPLDDCIKGGTIRHLMCAKLIKSMGGKLGIYEGTDEGQEAIEQIDALDMEEVRKVIKNLISQGLDNMKPKRPTMQEFLIAKETTLSMIGISHEIRLLFQQVAELLDEAIKPQQQLYDSLKDCILLCAQVSDGINSCKMEGLQQEVAAVIEMKKEGAEVTAKQFFSKLENDIDTTQYIQNVVDSDALALYEELDRIVASLEKRGRDSRHGRIGLAKEFNKCLMNLNRVEDAWSELTNIFSTVGEKVSVVGGSGSGYADGLYVTMDKMVKVLEVIRLDVTPADLRDLIAEVRKCKDEDSLRLLHPVVTPETLLCRSSKFRELLCKNSDEHSARLSTLVKSSVLSVLSFSDLQFLAWRCKNVTLEEGGKYRCKEPCMYFVVKGRIRTMLHNDGKDICVRLEYGPNTIFGEVYLLTGFAPLLMMRAVTKVELYEVSKSDLAIILQAKTQMVVPFAQALTRDSDFDKFEKEILKDSMKAEQEQQRAMLMSTAPTQAESEDLTVRALMDTIHRHFDKSRLELSTSLVLSVSVWRGIARSSKRSRQRMIAPDDTRKIIESGMQVVEAAWELFSAGLPTVEYDEVANIREFLGEVGQNFFATAFHRSVCPNTMTLSDWFSRWIKYIDDSDAHGGLNPIKGATSASFRLSSRSGEAEPPEDGSLVTDSKRQLENFQNEIHRVQPTLEEPLLHDRLHAWLRQKIFQLTHPSIVPMLLSDELNSAYEPTFCSIVGDAAKHLKREQVPSFLQLLLLDLQDHIADYHVDEFMELFSPDGLKGTSVSFPDIERTLREKRASKIGKEKFFMGHFGSAFNPYSNPMRVWRTIQQLCAIAYFLYVPAQIAFLPYDKLTNPSFLSTELVLDGLVFTNVLVSFNIAYMNKQSRWVSERRKIVRHYLGHDFWLDITCAAPFDWFGWLSGASMELSSWFRLPKILYFLSVVKESKIGFFNWMMLHQNIKLAFVIIAILHLTSCFWYFLGRRGFGMSTDEPTWYLPAGQASRRGGGGGAASGSYDYNMYGMYLSNSSGTWDRYLLSLYWISSTVSATGVIGDMLPQNNGEIFYALFLLIINLTVFNYVIGEISAGVLKGDERLLKAREELGAVESYLQGFDLPSDLKLEIRRYFQGTSGGSNFISASEIFDSVSHSLRLEMSSTMTRECLDNVVLFEGCSAQLKSNIQGLLREIHFGSEEFLFQSNMVAHEMYFVVVGFVDQIVQDSDGVSIHDKTVGPGGSVGDLSFFFGVRHINSARASSRSGAMCLRLVRTQIMPVLEAYPDDEEIVAQNALRQFKLTKDERNVNNSGRQGKSIASSTIQRLKEEERSVSSADEFEEQSLPTDYEQSMLLEDSFDAVILSNIEQKVAFLNQRRKTEHVAAFCGAASRGELEKMQRFLRIGLNVDETDSNGRTALHVAACEGKLEAVKLLITNSASVSLRDKYGNTPLNDAVRHGQDHIAAILRSQNQALNFPGRDAGVLLCNHAFHGKLEDIERLISNGINVNEANYDLRTALHLAACEGHEEVVKYLLTKSADVNCRDRLGRTPLCDALVHCHTNIQDILREAGGQLLGMDIAVELCTAAAKGDVAQLRALIRNRANPDAADGDRRTALHLASSNGETRVLDYLLRHLQRPININPVDRLGGTPLEDAYRHNQKVAIAMLEAAFGLRKDNPQVIEMQDVQRREVDALQKAERMPTVQEILSNSEESKADVWVRGRCGKLIPNQVSMISAASEQVEQDLREVIGCITAVKDTVLNLLSDGRLSATIEAGNVDFSQSLVFKELHAGSLMEDLRAKAEHLLQSLRSWSEVVGQIMTVISEELPAIKIVRLGSHAFRKEAETMLTLFRRLSAAGKFLDQTVRQTLQVVHVELSTEEETQQMSFRRTAVESRLMNNLEFPTKHLLQSALTVKG